MGGFFFGLSPPLLGAAVAWLRVFPRPPPLGLPPGRPLSRLFCGPLPSVAPFRGGRSPGAPAPAPLSPRVVSVRGCRPGSSLRSRRCLMRAVRPSFSACAAWLRCAPPVAASRRCSRRSLRAAARHGLWCAVAGTCPLVVPRARARAACAPLPWSVIRPRGRCSLRSLCSARAISPALRCCSLRRLSRRSRAACASLRQPAAAPLVAGVLRLLPDRGGVAPLLARTIRRRAVYSATRTLGAIAAGQCRCTLAPTWQRRGIQGRQKHTQPIDVVTLTW